MLKKLIYLLPFCLVFNAVAAPSTALLSKNKPSVNITKPVAVAQKSQPLIKSNTARATQSLVASKSKTTDLSDASARFPSLKIKSKAIGSNQSTNTNTGTNTGTSTNPISGNVSDSALNSLVQRVELLETNNANVVTTVVENGSGPYVSDVQKGNNELNVTKTHLLYAPIKNASGQTVSGNAEIWIIK